jgi:hypothetical protein
MNTASLKAAQSKRYHTLNDGALNPESDEEESLSSSLFTLKLQKEKPFKTKITAAVLTLLGAIIIGTLTAVARAVLAFATVFGGLIAFYAVTKWIGTEVFTVEIHQVTQPLQKMVTLASGYLDF